METQDGAEFCFPQLLNASCRKSKSPEMLFCVVMYSIALLTVTLNLFVIISISHFRLLHSPTNLLLLSLAFSDFLSGLVIAPLEIFRQAACWVLGDLLCFLFNYASFIITSVSSVTMVLISVDRYVAICHPLHYHTKITVARVNLCVLLGWIYSVFYNILNIKDSLTAADRHKSCKGECVFLPGYVSSIVDIVVTFIIPVTVITVLYMRVFVVAVSQARAMRSHIAAVKLSVTLTTEKSELKAARILGVVVLVYLICFCPYHCLSLAPQNLITNVTLVNFLAFLLFLNPCLNPVIYAYFYPWFGKAVRLIVTLQILQPGSCQTNIL